MLLGASPRPAGAQFGHPAELSCFFFEHAKKKERTTHSACEPE